MTEVPRSLLDSAFAHTCWHEAGHAVAAFLLHVPILEIMVLGPDEVAEHHETASKDPWGFVLYEDYPIDSLGNDFEHDGHRPRRGGSCSG